MTMEKLILACLALNLINNVIDLVCNGIVLRNNERASERAADQERRNADVIRMDRDDWRNKAIAYKFTLETLRKAEAKP